MADPRTVTDPSAAWQPAEPIRSVDPSAAPSPGAPPPRPPGAVEAEARIKAIYADPSHPFHRGDKRGTQEVYELHQQIHGTTPVAGGPRLGPDPDARLAGPIEHESLRAFSESFAQAGVPKEYAQSVVDVITSFKSDLPYPPAGYVPMTAAAGAEALAAALGPELAQQEIGKAQGVVDVLKSISPEVKSSLEYALGKSAAGNIPGIVRQFSPARSVAR